MIYYKMMDQQNLLCRCMHGGRVPVAKASQVIPDVSSDIVTAFLRKMVKQYGSCGVLALDKDSIIGVLWFYPQWVKQSFKGPICIQGENYDALKGLQLDSIPEKAALVEHILEIECMMVVRSDEVNYAGRGIGQGMIKHLISWAKDNDWTHIRARAIADIKPLMLWSGFYTVNRYETLGFKIIEGATTYNPGLLEGANSQKLGYHGQEFQQMWDEQYAYIDDTQITQVHTLVYTL